MVEDPQKEAEEKAVKVALEGKFEEAVLLNEEILESEPENIEALNRLGKAYFELGFISKAKTAYKKVLKLDPYNSIATKNFRRLDQIKEGDLVKKNPLELAPDLFLEEPGKTKTIRLEDLAMPSLLAHLRIGDRVDLIPLKEEVKVLMDDKRIGRVPKEEAKTILRALRSGCRFSALVQEVDSSKLKIFVKEIHHSPSIKGAHVFELPKLDFKPYVSEEFVQALADKEKALEEVNEEVDMENLVEPAKPLKVGHEETSLEVLAEAEEQLDEDKGEE